MSQYRRVAAPTYTQPVKQVPVHRRYASGKYRFVALIYVLRTLCPIAFFGLFLSGIFTGNKTLELLSLIPLVLFVLFTFIFWASANSVMCRLCKTPFLRHLSCTKKKGPIPHIFGDRSLATAVSLVLRKRSIVCQYCGERHKYFD